jgi:hypothetical protein
MYGVSPSGWMDKPNFYSWFVKGFLLEVKKLKLIPPKPAEQEPTQLSLPALVTAGKGENEDESNSDSTADGVDGPGVILFFDGHYLISTSM